jgi:hypothetical protein
MFLELGEVMEAADGLCLYKETTCWPLYILLQQPYLLITEDEQLGFSNILFLTPAPNFKGLVALCRSFLIYYFF